MRLLLLLLSSPFFGIRPTTAEDGDEVGLLLVLVLVVLIVVLRVWRSAHSVGHDQRVHVGLDALSLRSSIPDPRLGRGILHQLRERDQLALLRGVRRGIPKRQQLAVDPVHYPARRKSDLHRGQILAPKLRLVPGDGAAVQRDLQLTLL